MCSWRGELSTGETSGGPRPEWNTSSPREARRDLCGGGGWGGAASVRVKRALVSRTLAGASRVDVDVKVRQGGRGEASCGIWTRALVS